MPRFDRSCLWLVSCLALIAFCSLANAQATLQIMPASPRYQEPVYARITPDRNYGWYVYGAYVWMSGTRIHIGPEVEIDIAPMGYFDVELGRFPAGDYTVHLEGGLGEVASARFTVGERMPQQFERPGGGGTVPAVDYSGMWWDALESGWGLSISQGPTNQLFAAWFVYDAAGIPTWYTLELGEWRVSWSGAVYSGWLYRYTGPHFATAFDPDKVVGTLVGTGTLRFRDAFAGTLEYTMVHASGYKEITRLPIQ